MATAALVCVRLVHLCGPSLARDQSPPHPQTQWPGLRHVPCFERRPDVDAPLLDDRLIALDRPFAGQLRGPAQALQEPRDMRLVGCDAELLPDDRCYPSTRPHRATNAVCLRAMGEELRDQAQLGVCELDRPCGPRLGPPRLHARLPHLRHPWADSRRGNRKGLSNVSLFPPVLLELKRPLSACLFPGVGESMVSVHVQILAYGKNSAGDATVSKSSKSVE
jgi:hypothetical protein